MSKLIMGTMPDDEIAIDPVDYAIYHLYQSDYWIVGSNRYTLDHQWEIDNKPRPVWTNGGWVP